MFIKIINKKKPLAIIRFVFSLLFIAMTICSCSKKRNGSSYSNSTLGFGIDESPGPNFEAFKAEYSAKMQQDQEQSSSENQNKQSATEHSLWIHLQNQMQENSDSTKNGSAISQVEKTVSAEISNNSSKIIDKNKYLLVSAVGLEITEKNGKTSENSQGALFACDLDDLNKCEKINSSFILKDILYSKNTLVQKEFNLEPFEMFGSNVHATHDGIYISSIYKYDENPGSENGPPRGIVRKCDFRFVNCFVVDTRNAKLKQSDTQLGFSIFQTNKKLFIGVPGANLIDSSNKMLPGSGGILSCGRQNTPSVPPKCPENGDGGFVEDLVPKDGYNFGASMSWFPSRKSSERYAGTMFIGATGYYKAKIGDDYLEKTGAVFRCLTHDTPPEIQDSHISQMKCIFDNPIKISTLTPLNEQDDFGISLTNSKVYLFVGARGYSNNTGAIYRCPIEQEIIEKELSTNQETSLTPYVRVQENSDGCQRLANFNPGSILPKPGDRFGRSLAFYPGDENHRPALIIGAYTSDDGKGALYVCDENGEYCEKKALPSEILKSQNARFGTSLTIVNKSK